MANKTLDITQEYINFLNDIGAKGQIEKNPSQERIASIKELIQKKKNMFKNVISVN